MMAGMMGAGAGMMIGGNIMEIIAANKRKKSVPEWPGVSLGTSQRKSIAENVQTLPQAKELASSTNLFNQEQVLAMLNQAMPWYQGLSKDISAIISERMSGPSKEELAATQRATAAAGLAGGQPFTRSQFGKYGWERNIGRSISDTITRNISSAESWMQTSNALTKAPLMNVTSMFITPEQQYASDWQNEQMKFGQTMLRWGLPTGLEIAARQAQQAGGSMMGMGMSMGGGGMGGMGGMGGGSGGGGGGGYSGMMGWGDWGGET